MRMRSRVCLAVFPLVLLALVPGVGTGQNCESQFRRGDVDASGGLNLTDALRILGYLFGGDPAPACMDAADTDDDGRIVLTDAIFLLGRLFLGGEALPPPGEDCGFDPTSDALHCVGFTGCPPGNPPLDWRRDPDNCGECGRRCADLVGPHATLTGCEAGHCFVRRCEEGFADADGLFENGCETRAPSTFSPAWLLGIYGERNEPRIAATGDGSVWITTSISWFGRAESSDLACPRDLANPNHGILLARYDGSGRLEWSRFVGGNGRDEAEDLAVLPDGSSYVTGTFAHEVVLGSGEANQTTLASRGGQDILLARYEVDGKLGWARSGGGSDLDWGTSVAALPDGSCYATGSFIGETVLGAGEPNEARFLSVDPPQQVQAWKVTDAFLARYSPQGLLVWAAHVGGTGCNDIPEVKSLRDGSAAVAGYFCTEAILESADGVAMTLRADRPELNDPFLAVYRPDGSLERAMQVHTNGGYPTDLEERADGSLIFLFRIAANQPAATFDRGGPRETTIAGSDTILAAYDRDGTFLWARGIPGGDVLGMLPDGSALVAGNTDKPLTFGPGGANETLLAPLGARNLFTARFEADGEFSWARMAPSQGYQVPRDVAVLGDGSTYISGSYSPSMTLFAGEPGERTLTRDRGVFLARLAGPRIGAGNGPQCSLEHPAGFCPEGGACVAGRCEPRCAEEAFVCGPAVAHSSLPDVRIEFPVQPCRFTLSEVSAGIEIEYHVIVDQDVPGVTSEPSSAEDCGAPPPQSGLSVQFEQIHGGDQRYCICDAGLCMGRPAGERYLTEGSYTVRFPWDGRNWYGPSDTLNPPGPPFPPGEYTFEVYAQGTFQTASEPWEFEVIATFGIELVPD